MDLGDHGSAVAAEDLGVAGDGARGEGQLLDHSAEGPRLLVFDKVHGVRAYRQEAGEAGVPVAPRVPALLAARLVGAASVAVMAGGPGAFLVEGFPRSGR